MAFEKEIILIIAVSALLIYLFATKDNPYVPINERPKPWKSKRRVINYYGWKGPMFIEDFDGGCNPKCVSNTLEQENPLMENVPVSRPNPYINSPGSKPCVVPKYNTNNKAMKYCHRVARDKCRTPTLTSEQDWYNEYHNSTYKMTGPKDEGSLCRPPNWRLGDPGNYRQATNNNLDAPSNLKCGGAEGSARGRNKEFCAPKDRVSPVCYVRSLNDCLDEMMPDRN